MAKYQKVPYKSRLFDVYLHWKSIPAIYRGSPAELMEKIGIDDSVGLELLSVKTQAEFAQKFKVDTGTLSDWNKRIQDKGLIKPIYQETLKKVVTNAVASLAINQVKTPTPAGIKVLNDIANKEVKEKNIERIDEESGLENTNGSKWTRRYDNSKFSAQVEKILTIAYGEKKETKTEALETLDKISKRFKA